MPIRKLKPLKASPIQADKKTIQELLRHLPTYKPETLTHVGMLNGDYQPTYGLNLEGPLLPASEYPDDWCSIAKLGGLPEWEIFRTDGKPFRLLSRLSPGWGPLKKWGTETGSITIETWWMNPIDSDEDGEPRFCWGQTPEENSDPESTEKPKKRRIPIYRPALSLFWTQRQKKPNANKRPGLAIDALAAALIEAAHRTLDPNDPLLPDGLFWDETLLPENLSAPRAGIFPHNGIKAQKVKT